MWQAIPAIIGAAGSIIGGALGNKATKDANRANIKLQKDQWAWEENMSNTAWQRGTADMLKAGINPMLATSAGPASTPNVGAASVRPADSAARGVSSAADKAMEYFTLQNMRNQARLTGEKADQEHMLTNDMREDRSTVTITDEEGNQVGGMSPVQRRRALETAQAELAKSNLTARDLENKVLEATLPYNVSSARARAELLDKEVNIAELRTILMNLDIPEKEAMAKWFATIGTAGPAAKAVMSISSWLKFILGGK